MPVTAQVSAYPGRDFSGKVTAINASVDPTSRVFIVEARFENGNSELRPGMFAKARVLLPAERMRCSCRVAPSYATRPRTPIRSSRLKTVKPGCAWWWWGDAEGDLVRIASGLTGNETVAVNHLSELYDGAAVESHN